MNDVDSGLEPLEALKVEDCFTLGPFEEALALLQIAQSKALQSEPSGAGQSSRVGSTRTREAERPQTMSRSRLRDLFATK
ncbi:MAG: hypothetical protein ABI551_20085 [Polyangiaceae bacterium]